MRLRLRIERNELPPVSVLWAIGDTERKQTVAQFLARVDERFPIEGGCWGAEDYSVSVGGFELLHYYEVGSYFQHEDEVVIKPLSTAEVRARRFTGREQISRDGRHMVDGVPWGKPCLKRPMRADLNIPPRKKQRTDDEGLLALDDGQRQALVHFEDELDDEDEEDDVDFELDESDSGSGDSSDDDEEDEEDGESDSEEQPAKRRKTRSSTLKLNAGPSTAEFAESDDSDEVSSSDEDSDSSEDDSSSDDSSEDSSSDSDDASSEASWNGIDSGTSTTPHTPNSSLLSETVAETLRVAPNKQTTSAPFEGKSETKIRNSRRRDQRKLKHLKQLGVLPSNATLADMANMPAEDLELQIKKNQVIRNALNMDDLQEPEVEATNDSPPSELLQAQAALNEAQNTINTGMKSPLTNGDAAAAATDADDEAPEVEPATLKRKRLDVSGTNRFIFGHLGVRTPKTQAEKDALQKKLSDRAKQHGLAKSAPSPAQQQQAPQPEEEEDLDAWTDKVQLSAVECIDEGVILSTPPFPFKQRWDPQYQYKNPPKRQKKRKTNVNGTNGVYIESYDKYNPDGTGDALNYDDAEDDAFEDDSYWEEGALLDDTDNGDEEMESTRQQGTLSDGFPALPNDTSTLPTLTETDALVGDYVVFSELAVSAATGWQPGTISRTVRLEGKDDGAWNVKVAQRDLPPKEYNNEGNRVYSKFEMEGLSEDEGDDSEKTLQWSEMQDPRLLQRAATE